MANPWRSGLLVAVAALFLGLAGPAPAAEDRPRQGGELLFIMPAGGPPAAPRPPPRGPLCGDPAGGPPLQHAAPYRPDGPDGHADPGRFGRVLDGIERRPDLHGQ